MTRASRWIARLLPCTVKVFLYIRFSGTANRWKFFEIFTRESDNGIAVKMKNESSLTSLRKDNEVKLEEIKEVCNLRER